jgi:hypothetical protein
MVDGRGLRRTIRGCCRTLAVCVLIFAVDGGVYIALAQQGGHSAEISIEWKNTLLVSRSTPTLQVVVNPMLRPGSPIEQSAWTAVRDLGADFEFLSHLKDRVGGVSSSDHPNWFYEGTQVPSPLY